MHIDRLIEILSSGNVHPRPWCEYGKLIKYLQIRNLSVIVHVVHLN